MLAHPSVTCKLYEAVKHEIKIPNARNSIVISSAMVEFWRPRDHDHQHLKKKKKATLQHKPFPILKIYIFIGQKYPCSVAG